MARRIERAAGNPRLQAALASEARLARTLVNAGFDVGSEVPTPTGRACDLVARKNDVLLHFHVKSIEDEHLSVARSMRMPRVIHALERIERRLEVEIVWRSRLSASSLKALSANFANFLTRASIGDEHSVCGQDGRMQGRCRVRCAHEGPCIRLHVGIADDRAAIIERMDRLMRKARAQFLAGGENIIVLMGEERLQWLFAQALLGTPIERWDRLPRRGERIAIGRASDGFWKPGRDLTSRIAAWQSIDSTRASSVAWFRACGTSRVRGECRALFDRCNEVE
ncbi:MAG: hypothetical protein FJ285_01535 [Planctomycetes bacterium]|nr:hypothetical protein [Planctomycetota bacterium]